MQRQALSSFTRRRPSSPTGFTLIELMVTVSIIAVLMSLLAPALQRTIGSARGFKCQTALRSVAFDFALFADPAMHGPRGEDIRLNNRFRIATFQESEYGIDEFWRHGDDQSVTIEADDSAHHLRCSEVAGAITLNQNTPCTAAGSISPPQNVSFGFNARLNRIEAMGPFGPAAQSALLSSEILEHPDVPLAWDVDGAQAVRQGVMTPQFSAPAMDSQFLYVNNRYWFPGFRHNGSINVAFIGGHVLSSRDPLNEPGWQWGFQPPQR